MADSGLSTKIFPESYSSAANTYTDTSYGIMVKYDMTRHDMYKAGYMVVLNSSGLYDAAYLWFIW